VRGAELAAINARVAIGARDTCRSQGGSRRRRRSAQALTRSRSLVRTLICLEKTKIVLICVKSICYASEITKFVMILFSITNKFQNTYHMILNLVKHDERTHHKSPNVWTVDD
jgi:hypothetical protein